MTRSSLLLSALLVSAGLMACATGPIPGGTPSPDEIPDLEASWSESPDDRTTRLRLGAAYLSADRPEEALGLLEEMAEEDDVALFLKAGALEALGEWDRAREAHDRVRLQSERSDLVQASGERVIWVRRQQLRDDVARSLEREAELADQPPRREAVAVFPFVWEGAETEYTPLSRALAEMLVTDLGRVEGVDVLERLRIQALLDEIALSEEERVDPATAVRSGRILGAGRIVQGRMGGGEELLSVLAGLVDAIDDDTVAEVDESDPAEAFFDLQARIAFGILAEMGVSPTEEEQERILLAPTTNLEALVLWGRALEAQDAGDFGVAAALFRDAAALDPDFEDAEERARESEQLEDQAAVNPGTFTGSVVGGLQDRPLGPRAADPGQVRVTYQPIEGLLPGPEIRDAGPELLGNEGIGSGTTFLDIILRIPR